MKRKGLWLSSLLFVLTLLTVVFAITLTSYAEGDDAMTAIEESLMDYRCADITKEANDGYLGIPVEVSVYKDPSVSVKSGKAIDATPIIIYVVNTQVERIGTESDVSIIRSMLDRGYVVVIFDYLGNTKAVSPALDYSVQTLREKVTKGNFFSGLSGFGGGSYNNNFVVPAGYDVSLNNVFWEIDKHSADGTFDKIVEVWNNDFRAWSKNKELVIKWVDENGNRKATQDGHDGSSPVWLDENGNEALNGQYIKIKHTKAEKIEDCVQSDGTPIDLNLYMHIVYPTSPEKDVPVMTLVCSSGHLASGTQTADRPQLNGFLFNGYAGATYDHAFVPMARDDHYGYFDGSNSDNGSVSGYNVTYSVQFFNDVKINTAAMRYLRYLSGTDHDTYSFKTTSIGIYGNSKGGWSTLLGEEHPELLTERSVVPGYTGQTRYEVGKTETVGFIDGGEEQPWLGYDSGADLVYSSCGGGVDSITAEHAPTFISCNKGDSSYYNNSNRFVNACRSLNVPAMWFAVDQGHTLASDVDLYHGVSTYDAFFAFAGYYLKGDAVKVVYADRDAEYSGMPTNGAITVKFSGAVSASEMARVTLKDSNGNPVEGLRLTSHFGDTEWTISTPTLKGDTEYTLTVPADLAGDNGKTMGADYVMTFRTGYEKAVALESVRTANGTYYYATVPANALDGKATDLYTLRVNVTDYSVNALEVYALSGFNASSPDSAAVGALVGTIPVSGIGAYDLDLTLALSAAEAGDVAAFLVKQSKTAGSTVISSSPLSDTLGSISMNASAVYSFGETPDGVSALKVDRFLPDTTSYVNYSYYPNPYVVFTCENIVKTSNLVESDLGRTFHISFRVYDTESRLISVHMNSLTVSSKDFTDYQAYYYNFYTKANEWVDIEFDYTVYEPEYAQERGYVKQKLSVYTYGHGDAVAPIYFSEVESVETVTDVTLGTAELLISTTEQREDPLITEYGTIPEIYADEKEYPYVLFDRSGNVLSAGKTLVTQDGTSGVLSVLQNSTATTSFPNNDAILLVRDDVTFDITYSNFSFQFGKLLIDLNGHTFTCTGSLFSTVAKRCGSIETTVKNGTWVRGAGSLMTLNSVSSASYNYAEYGIREFNFIFDNVRFEFVEGTTVSPFVARASSVASPVKSSVVFKDCTFDLTGATVPSDTVLFNATTDSNKKIDTTIEIVGCKLIADSLDGSFIGKADEGSEDLTLSRNSRGELITVILPSSAGVPAGSYIAGGQGAAFNKVSEADGYITYAPEVDPCWTPYGQIPAQYASIGDYPFVSFKVNADGTYTFQNAEKDIFLDASAMFVAARSYTAVIYMRRDYEVTNDFNNFGWCKNVTIDLAGHTLTYGTHRMALTCKKGWDKNITFKNGTIKAGNTDLLFFKGDSSGSGYYFRMIFEEVIFDLSAAGTNEPLMKLNNSSYQQGAYVTFNGCTFILPAASQNNETLSLFNANDAGSFTCHVTVNGGKVISPLTLDKVRLCNIGGTNSVTFGKWNGEYATIECSVHGAKPTYDIKTAEGDKIYAHSGTASSGAELFTLLDRSCATTKYGNLTYRYANAEIYPFVQYLINADGTYNFLGAEANIFADASELMISARSKSTVILLRRDFEKSDSKAHTNLCHINGTLIIDLDGHTLSAESGYFYDANVKKNVLTTTVIFKNGTIVMGDSAFIKSSSTFNQDSGKTGKQTFNFVFEEITFKANGSTASHLSVRLGNDGLLPYIFNTTYANCVFDLTAGVHRNLTLFESGTTDGKVTGTVTVEGCTVKGLIFGSHRLALINNDSSEIIFKEYNGAYVTAYATGDASDTVVRTEKGGALFTEIGDGIYTLTPCTHYYDGAKDAECNVCEDLREIKDYGFELKVNLTLGSEIRLNFYTPKDGNLIAIYVNGEALTLGGEHTVDGVAYRVYRYNGIAPSAAMVTFVVTVEYTEGDETKSLDMPYSILKYAKTVLTTASVSEAGRAVVRDMVGFIGAAYDYFGNEDATAEELALLSELLASYPATKVESIPDGNGNTADISAVVKSAQFDLSDGVIRLRLNLCDTAAPLTVKMGEDTLLTLGAGHGKDSVTVDMRAYRLTEEITITSGALNGSYSFLDYAEYILGTDDALDALLKAMYAYGVSSAEYRTENN